MTHVKSFTEWRIVSAGGHESAKVSSVSTSEERTDATLVQITAAPKNLKIVLAENTDFSSSFKNHTSRSIAQYELLSECYMCVN